MSAILFSPWWNFQTKTKALSTFGLKSGDSNFAPGRNYGLNIRKSMLLPVSHLSMRFETEFLRTGDLARNLESSRLSQRVDSPDIATEKLFVFEVNNNHKIMTTL